MIDLEQHFVNAVPEIKEAFLRDHGNLEKLVADLHSISQDISNPDWVIKKLKVMNEIDQCPRAITHFFPDDKWKADTDIYRKAFEIIWGNDDTNRAELLKLINHHGWITIPRFGEDANKTALTMTIHADNDKDFQRRILALLEENYMDPALSAPQGYAYLYDRTCFTNIGYYDESKKWQTGFIVDQCRPQRYGSQGQPDPNDIWQPYEIEDIENVDERRKSMKLPSLSEYFNLMNDHVPEIGRQPICPIPIDAAPIYK